MGSPVVLWVYCSQPRLIFRFRFDAVNGYGATRWCGQNWWLPLSATVVYLITLVVIVTVMRNRKPMELRSVLIGWNGLLAAFSMVGMVVSYPSNVSPPLVLSHFCYLAIFFVTCDGRLCVM